MVAIPDRPVAVAAAEGQELTRKSAMTGWITIWTVKPTAWIEKTVKNHRHADDLIGKPAHIHYRLRSDWLTACPATCQVGHCAGSFMLSSPASPPSSDKTGPRVSRVSPRKHVFHSARFHSRRYPRSRWAQLFGDRFQESRDRQVCPARGFQSRAQNGRPGQH